MTKAEFDEYFDRSTRSFAAEAPRFRDMPTDQAVQLSREEFHKILPNGHESKGHFLWSIFKERTRVGYLHIGERQGSAGSEVFAWDFEVFDAFRRQGVAKAAMLQAGEVLKRQGYRRVGLNVFGESRVAIKLYESMGFKITQVQMQRDIL